MTHKNEESDDWSHAHKSTCYEVHGGKTLLVCGYGTGEEQAEAHWHLAPRPDAKEVSVFVCGDGSSGEDDLLASALRRQIQEKEQAESEANMARLKELFAQAAAEERARKAAMVCATCGKALSIEAGCVLTSRGNFCEGCYRPPPLHPAEDDLTPDEDDDDPMVLQGLRESQLDEAIELGRELHQLRQGVATLATERDALEKTCSERDERIAELKEEVLQLQEQNAALRTLAESQQAQLRESLALREEEHRACFAPLPGDQQVPLDLLSIRLEQVLVRYESRLSGLLHAWKAGAQ